MQSNLITVRKRESTVDHGPQRARLGGATAVGHDESHTGRKFFAYRREAGPMAPESQRAGVGEQSTHERSGFGFFFAR